MNIARHDHTLVDLHGRLYDIGGTNINVPSQSVDSFEVYNPDNNTWTGLQHRLDGKVEHNGASYEILSN